MKQATISVSEFKAKCLRLLEEVGEHGRSLIITKHGRPVAKVTPIEAPRRRLRGSWKGRIRVAGDIVHFNVADDWESAG